MAGLHPTAEQIEMFAYHLPHATLSNLIVGLYIQHSYIIILLTSNHHHLKHSVSVLLLWTGYICESRTSGWTLLCLQHR